MKNTEIERLYKEISDLKAQIRNYEDYVERISEWKDEGEKIMDAAKQWPLFRFATWWADRPWRK